MVRTTLGEIVGAFLALIGVMCLVLLAASPGFAQAPGYFPQSTEPPMAEPGETTPAPTSTIVTVGEPRVLPSGLEVVPLAPGATVPETPSGVQPAQYIVPAPKPPAFVYPEPPTPLVKISVKGMDTAPSGQELTYQFTVTNISEARAHHVIARCPVPKGAKLVKALPQPKEEGKDLEWQLDTLEPGATRQIEVVFKPNADATEIAVVGKVSFEHGRVIRTKIANPTLELKKMGAAQGILHEPMLSKIVLTNPGAVPVTDIRIVSTLPEGLEYVQEASIGATPVSKVGPAPNQRTWTIGTLQPNENRTIEYRVIPRKIGEWTSQTVVTGTGVEKKAGWNTSIQEARLTLQITGPAQDKANAHQSTPYQIFVHNTGTAVLHNVRVTCAFPHEMRMAKVAIGGQLYKDAVQWLLPKLEPNETKELLVSLTAPSAGLRDIVFSARANKGLEQRKKVSTSFEGSAALNWQTEGTPVASPGQEIVYTITIKNPGSAPAKNVKIVADLPEQIEFRNAQPAFQRGQGAIFFNPIEIAPKQEVKLKVIAVAKKAGEARFQFEMTAEGMSSGPLKHSKATKITSGGNEPKDLEKDRIGTVPKQNWDVSGDSSVNAPLPFGPSRSDAPNLNDPKTWKNVVPAEFKTPAKDK